MEEIYKCTDYKKSSFSGWLNTECRMDTYQSALNRGRNSSKMHFFGHKRHSMDGFSAHSFIDYTESLGSTVGSWDESEQDYDAKATHEVQDMLEHLDEVLYKESQPSDKDNTLLEECNEWSFLFPHFRVRGNQLSLTKESGYELICRDMAQGHSSCPSVPEYSSNTFQNDSMKVQGVSLASSTVVQHNHTPESELKDVYVLGESRSMVDWTDPVVRLTLSRLRDDRYDNSYWAVYQCRPVNDHAYNDELDDGSQTPTQSNPIKLTKTEPCLAISVVCDGIGGVTALQSALLKLWGSKHPGRIAVNVFAIMKTKHELPINTLPVENTVDKQHRLLMWTVFDWTLSCSDSCNFDTHQHSDQPYSPTCSQKPYLGPVDYLEIFQTHAAYVFLWSGSSSDFFLESASTLSQKLQNELNQENRFTHLLGEEVFSTHGSAEEWLACHETSDITNHSESYQQLSEHPYASVREDIVSSVFEELWAEIVPVFHDLVCKYAQSLHPHNKISFSDQGVGMHEVCVEDTLPNLLSAITIRSVPLQKRDSSARSRLDSSVSTFQAFNSDSQTASNRPVSAWNVIRPTSARSCATRPTSAKNQDAHYHIQPPSRIPSGISKALYISNWKRNNPGMRLVPLLATQTGNATAINDAISVTNIGFSKQASSHIGWDASRGTSQNPQQHLGKKLPPIRSYLGSEMMVSDIPNIAKQTKHVLFDPAAMDFADAPRRVPSPRLSSARRHSSALLRNRASRPNTAIEEARSTVKLISSKSISPVMGTKMIKGFRRYKN
ncbi:hypothetical protein O5D80_002417 [Batrachochytrium dendrobatidis]|nr:hypothetical protein O5D80_002417 [Batrachochytrium dendrobatidis]